jgi:hypothetical protein
VRLACFHGEGRRHQNDVCLEQGVVAERLEHVGEAKVKADGQANSREAHIHHHQLITRSCMEQMAVNTRCSTDRDGVLPVDLDSKRLETGASNKWIYNHYEVTSDYIYYAEPFCTPTRDSLLLSGI